MNEMMSSPVASPAQSPRPEVPPPTIEDLHGYANLWGKGASTKVDELRRFFRAFAVWKVYGEDKYCTEVNRQCRIWKVDVKPKNFPENLWKNPNNGPDRLKQPQLIDAMDHIIHLFKESSDQPMARHPPPVNGAQASGTSSEYAYAASLYLMNLTEKDLCPRPDILKEAIDAIGIDSGTFSGEGNSQGGSIPYCPQTVSPPQQVPVQSITNNNTVEDSSFDLDKIILQPLSPETEAYLGTKLIRRMNLSGRSSPISLQEKDPEAYNELMRQIEPSAAEVTEEMDTTSPPPSPSNALIPMFVMDEDAFD